MEPVSIATFTLASILASFPATSEPVSQSVITTHISPAIAGQWEIELDSINRNNNSNDDSITQSLTIEPEVIDGLQGGIIEQDELRIFDVVVANKSATTEQAAAKTATGQNPDRAAKQCRELYNFGADNEMWAVSGKEWTYGRYLITHREEGLPIIAIKTVYDNNEVDCSGNQIDQTDEILLAFLEHNGNQMQWCANPDGTQCFMRFQKVLP
jgi:hypothetical protein